MKNIPRTTKRDARHGAVAVEFAVMAPILLTLMLGMIEMGRAFEMTNQLEVAAREGARFAAMDRDGMLQVGQTSNAKVIADVTNFLASNGMAPADITVELKDFENPALDFDLDNPLNDLKLFEVRVSVDFSKVSLMPIAAAHDYPLTASVVFRNGRASLAE